MMNNLFDKLYKMGIFKVFSKISYETIEHSLKSRYLALAFDDSLKNFVSFQTIEHHEYFVWIQPDKNIHGTACDNMEEVFLYSGVKEWNLLTIFD